MTIAEKTLQGYLTEYKKKESELQVIENEIRLLRSCENWLNEKPEEIQITPEPEPVQHLETTTKPTENVTRITISTPFSMSDVPERRKGFAGELIRKGHYSLGALIRAILIDAGISGNQLADDMQISRGDIKNMILNKKVPYSQTKEKLVDALSAYTDVTDAKNRIEIACRRTKNKREKENAQ